MNLVQIQTFIEVAKYGSFSKASRSLSLPRSTVSARIGALEERLNLRLLHRTTRRVSLTNDGQRYFDRCRKAITLLNEAEAEFDQPDKISGKIRVSAPIDMSKKYLAEILAEFTDTHPLIEVEIIISDETVDLIENNIDLAIRGKSPGKAGLSTRKLGSGKLFLVASPQYLAQNIPLKTADDLLNHTLFDPTGYGNKLFAQNVAAAKIKTQNFELAKELAIQSKGIALLPESICKNELSHKKLILLKISHNFPELPLYIVMPTLDHMPVRVRTFIDHLISKNKSSQIL